MRGQLAGRLAEFVGWVREALGDAPMPVVVLDAKAGPLPDPEPGDVVVTTGGRGSTYSLDPWSEAAADWLRGAVQSGLPVFAICYGHQLLAHALGGRVALNPDGPEHGTCEVRRIAHDPLFEGIDERFFVYQTHFDAVLDPPAGAVVLARSERTAVQAMAIGDRVRTIQWHPECWAEGKAPPERTRVLRNFLRHCAGLDLPT
jgi:GMP synthase (glutamine-hydrolysing)